MTDIKKPNKSPPKSKLSLKKVKCTFCLKEFPNINHHLSKSFPCQNAYQIDDMIHKSFESDDSIESTGPPLKKRKEDKGCREKYECSGCKKNYLNIWLHLKKTEGCQKHYDMFKVEEDHKETLRVKKSLKMQKYRKSKGDEKRKQDNEQLKKRMKAARERRDDDERQQNNEQAKKGMEAAREKKDYDERQQNNEQAGMVSDPF